MSKTSRKTKLLAPCHYHQMNHMSAIRVNCFSAVCCFFTLIIPSSFFKSHHDSWGGTPIEVNMEEVDLSLMDESSSARSDNDL
jgi:hypothetical protein